MVLCQCGCGKNTNYRNSGKLSINNSRFIFGHHTNGMKGKRHTEEAKRKVGDASLGHKLNKKSRMKIRKALKGKPKSEEHKKNLSISLIGKVSGAKGKHWKMSKKGKKNASIIRSKYLKTHPDEMLKGIRIMMQKSSQKPNETEKYIDAILQLYFPHEYKYVGDGEIWIKKHNPDWINCNGQKKIIEYDGFPFRHSTKEGIKRDLKRNKDYVEFGNKVLVLHFEDLKNEIILVNKIRIFNNR